VRGGRDKDASQLGGKKDREEEREGNFSSALPDQF